MVTSTVRFWMASMSAAPSVEHAASVAEELDELVDQMVELIADAKVYFDADKHKAINEHALAALAKGDPWMYAEYLDHKDSILRGGGA